MEYESAIWLIKIGLFAEAIFEFTLEFIYNGI